jgi:exopolysaccharide biosynthesis protein
MRSTLAHVLCAAALLATHASAAVVTTTPYLGVKLHTFNLTTPRNEIIYVAEINLAAKGIRIQNTGPSGGAAETNFETTRSYASRVGAQLAINTAFFSAGTNNVNGLLWSNGVNVSPNDVDSRAVLNVSQDNVAIIGTERNPATDSTGITGNPDIYNAVAGSQRIIRNGEINTAALTGGSGAPTSIAARTAAGVSEDHRTLYLMTVQGNSSATSASGGMTVAEVASFLFANFPIYDALNLDGGGSASFVYDSPGDATGPLMLNNPIDGGGTTQRAVAANLAVFAIVPEPVAMFILPIGFALLCRWR